MTTGVGAELELELMLTVNYWLEIESPKRVGDQRNTRHR